MFVGVLGVEPRPLTPEASVLPLYYTPYYVTQYLFFVILSSFA